MSQTTRLVTADELEKFPEDDFRYELVEGRLIRMSPVGYEHGGVVARFLLRLGEHLRDKDIGVVMPEVGFTLKFDPDTVRAPDIAFIRQDRTLSPDTPGFFKGPPDVAVEVLSPDDRPAEIREKVEEYLAHGVPLAVVVDPRQRTVTAHRRLTPPVVAQADTDVVDLGDVIADFQCTLRDILG